MKYLLLFFMCFCMCFNTQAQSNYAYELISPELLENADAVVRDEQTVLTLVSSAKSLYSYKLAITILNSRADKYAHIAATYDKLLKVDGIKGAVYDKNGALIRKLERSDINDYSNYSIEFYGDARVKEASLVHTSYPYTVVYEYQYESYMNLSYWSFKPQWSSNISVQKATYTVIGKPEIIDNFRYQEINMPSGKTDFTNEDGTSGGRWQVENIKAFKAESFSLALQFPVVFLTPKKFEVEGHTGKLESWEDVGRWYWDLMQGRQTLPADEVAKIHQLTDGVADARTKAKILYEYMQSRTRYVLVSLGIGGWQPYDATYVSTKGYGDCKALTNYMYAMLKEVGISSYPALVNAGSEAYNKHLDASFPKSSFNHVFLCVPIEKDTVWLECTSQTTPFGFMGTFTSDRQVLLVTPQGGRLVKTPNYTLEHNKQSKTAIVTLDPSANGNVTITANYAGLTYDKTDYLQYYAGEEQKQELYKLFDINNSTISQYRIDYRKDLIPSMSIQASLQVKSCATKSGNRLFITPNLLSQRTSMPSQTTTERKNDVYISEHLWQVDTIVYAIPDGYHIEYKPDDLTISSAFGEYKVTILAEQGKITYIRSCQYFGGKYPKEKYNEFLEFLRNVVKADKNKIVLVTHT